MRYAHIEVFDYWFRVEIRNHEIDYVIAIEGTNKTKQCVFWLSRDALLEKYGVIGVAVIDRAFKTAVQWDIEDFADCHDMNLMGREIELCHHMIGPNELLRYNTGD